MGAQYFHIPYCPGTSFGVCVTAIVPTYESTSGSRYKYELDNWQFYAPLLRLGSIFTDVSFVPPIMSNQTSMQSIKVRMGVMLNVKHSEFVK